MYEGCAHLLNSMQHYLMKWITLVMTHELITHRMSERKHVTALTKRIENKEETNECHTTLLIEEMKNLWHLLKVICDVHVRMSDKMRTQTRESPLIIIRMHLCEPLHCPFVCDPISAIKETQSVSYSIKCSCTKKAKRSNAMERQLYTVFGTKHSIGRGQCKRNAHNKCANR